MSGFVRVVITLLTLGMEPKDALRLVVTLALSVGGHIALALVMAVVLPLVSLFREAPPIEITVVEAAPEIEEVEAEPPPPEPEPEPPPEPEPVAPRPRPEPRPEPRPATPDPPPAPPPEEAAPEPPPAAAEAIEDFSGLTLTNPTGDSWASNLGNGEAIEGPIGQPNARVTGRRREGVPGGVPGGTGDGEGSTVLPAASLSRPPGPPNDRLRELLRSNYPREAQQLGLEGHADVRVRVHADGRVEPLRTVYESHEGFGEACRRTLRQGGRWQPPLDRQGRPATTDTVFRCGFTVTGF